MNIEPLDGQPLEVDKVRLARDLTQSAIPAGWAASLLNDRIADPGAPKARR